jgi:cyclophilin family peptidyl-prolyl cis-trans isomerase
MFILAQEGGFVSERIVRTETDAAELGPKNQVFMNSLNEYRELTRRLQAMKIEYQDASAERRAEIDAQYHDLFRQGLEIHKRSIELALDANDETPNRNPAVTELLYSTVIWSFNREHYEEAVRIFKRLEQAGLAAGTDRHYVFAGLSALLSMNYEEAEKWIAIAIESGELENQFRSWMQSESGQTLARTMRSQMQMMGERKEAWEKEQEIRREEARVGAQDPAKRLPRVEITTTKGKIVLELFENEAPNTVANFISLVESGFYNNTLFHRVLPNFMAQGGQGRGVSFTIACETGNRFPNARKHFRGSISMANAGPNTNGSQFFLTFVPTVHLDGGHTVFGRIVEGIEVLSDIQRVDPTDQQGIIPERDRIIEARVLNKRAHAYEVNRNER